MKIDKNKCVEILNLAWPLIVANSFWNLQLTIDRIYLGSFSTEALAASMAAMSVFWAPMALLQQTASYVTTFVAQYTGSNNSKMIAPALWHSVYLGIGGGLLFLLFIFFSIPFFNLVGHAQNIKVLEIEYFNVICFSALPMALIGSFSGYFTGISRTKMVMLINVAGLIANVILDYLLIFGNFGFKAYGMVGAGYATVIANFVSVLFGFALLAYHSTSLSYSLFTSFALKKDLMFRYFKYGVPSGLQWSLEGLAFTVFLILIGRLQNGEAALAASSIAVTVMMLSVLPSIGVAQSVMAKVGESLGEKRPKLAESYAWAGVQVSAIYMSFVGLTFFIFPGFYIHLFESSGNPKLWREVENIAPIILMFIAFFTSFDSIYLNLSFALKGAGDTKFVSLVALLMPWPIMVLPVYLLRDQPNAVYYSWLASTIYVILTVLIILARFRGKRWQKMSVID